jgi:hypothetical protein
MLDYVLELLKNVDSFTGPALLLLIGGVFKVIQMRMQDRRRTQELAAKKAEDDRRTAENLAAEQRRRDEDTKREAMDMARKAQEKAEETAKVEREKLERQLEREREDRKTEADNQRRLTESMIHNLNNKLQSQENLKGIHEKQVELMARERNLLQEKLDDCHAKMTRLKRRLQRHEPLGEDE